MRLPRIRAVVFLAAVSTVGWANAGETCNRDWFYVNWPIENRMDLRQILLLERAVGDPIVYETPEGRQRVGRGTWVDELTGAVYRAIDPNALEEDLRDAEAKYGIDLKFQQLQIDHIIPLNWACEHGADLWSAKKRRDFATDELLLAIDGQIFTAAGTSSSGFFGITTDGGFTEVRLVSPDFKDFEYAGIDNITYTPEPTSLALLGLGGLLVARRRR